MASGRARDRSAGGGFEALLGGSGEPFVVLDDANFQGERADAPGREDGESRGDCGAGGDVPGEAAGAIGGRDDAAVGGLPAIPERDDVGQPRGEDRPCGPLVLVTRTPTSAGARPGTT